jgi:GxxExxY protein
MHVNEITELIIGLAIEVHRHLGPGLPEIAYERALCMELSASGLAYRRQVPMPIVYKGEIVAEHRPDLVVAETVVVDIKSVDRLAPVHSAQMRTYLRITGLEVGLLLNFNEPVLKDGIQRVVLQRGAKSL